MLPKKPVVDTYEPGPEPQEHVRRPVMYQSWNVISFLHWRYDPAEIRCHVPSRLEVDTFDGSAWVSITPFLMDNLRWPLIPPLPWLSRTPETNVRTYVRGPDGRRGIWFFSLDIARLPAVAFARVVYRLPYMWSRLSLERDGDLVRYRGRRRWGGPRAVYDLEIEALDAIDGDDLDHFLTARWVLFSRYGTRLGTASAEHPRWPLRRGVARRLDQSLTDAAGLPPPVGDPLVHFSEGVDVRISAPRIVRG
jgi:uncharacterized protein